MYFLVEFRIGTTRATGVLVLAVRPYQHQLQQGTALGGNPLCNKKFPGCSDSRGLAQTKSQTPKMLISVTCQGWPAGNPPLNPIFWELGHYRVDFKPKTRTVRSWPFQKRSDFSTGQLWHVTEIRL